MNEKTKVCEDCTQYLTCKKVTAEMENQPACEQFEDNFPEDVDDFDYDEETA
jgi:hypothetical protein